jgi:hypothetical protein
MLRQSEARNALLTVAPVAVDAYHEPPRAPGRSKSVEKP